MRRIKCFFLIVCAWIFSFCTNSLEEGVKKNGERFRFERAVMEVQSFAGLSIDSIDTNQLIGIFNFKLLDNNGNVRTSTLREVFKHYVRITSKQKESYPLPIFESKQTENCVLVLPGKGQWGILWCLVEVDRKSINLNRIDFIQKYEAPPAGQIVDDSTFENQFILKRLYLDDRHTFGLAINDSICRVGEHQIDGVSGSTVTQVGFVDGINLGLKHYGPYLNVQLSDSL